MFGWYSIVPNNFWGWKKTQKPFLHLSLSKAGPFVLEKDICVKALKCKVFQIIRCIIKPLLKNSIHTIFQGDTSWVAELLNNMNVWMVLYCAQQLLGLKKNKNPFSTFLWVNWNQLKVNWNQLKVNWNQLKSIKSKLKSIKSKLKSIESKLKVYKLNQLKVNWNQLKVNWNQLKLNWFQLKVIN